MKSKPINSDMDAKRWAREFMESWGHRLKDVDEDTMRGWFANAIMCGWDNHYWTTPEYKAMMARVLGPEQTHKEKTE